MFKDLKEYQDITQIYLDSVNISEEQRAINKIFAEEDFTLEEIEYLEENWDELWENELAQFTQECIVESFEGQNLTEEQIQQLDEVLGLKLLAKGLTKAGPAIGRGLRKANVGITKGLKFVGKKLTGGAKAVKRGVGDTVRGAVSVGKSALKKVSGAIKKAAPIIGKGALLGTGAALPLAGTMMGVNALRNRGKAEREKAAAAASKGGSQVSREKKSKIGDAVKGGAQASKDAGKNVADAGKGSSQALKNIQKTKETKTKLLSTPIKDTTELGSKVRQVKPGSSRDKMIAKNEARHGKDSITKKRNMNADFQAYKKGKITKAQFIDKYPKSITAQREAGLRDHTEWDAYDMVLEYLFSTEQVTSLEEANYVMMEMDQQTIGEIVKEVKVALGESIGSAAGKLMGGLAGKVVGTAGSKAAPKESKAGSKAAPTGGTARSGTAAGPRTKKPSSGAVGPRTKRPIPKTPGRYGPKLEEGIAGAAMKLGGLAAGAYGIKKAAEKLGTMAGTPKKPKKKKDGLIQKLKDRRDATNKAIESM